MSDTTFIDLIGRATEVTLLNEDRLGEDRRLFPTDNKGVAQGSPLSPLFGNIILSEFDDVTNGHENICVRFIDDFVILAKTPTIVRDTFDIASKNLAALGLSCQNPYTVACDPAKADYGPVAKKIIFLGHQIEPGLLQPSRPARKELLTKVRSHISNGRTSIKTVKGVGNSFSARMRFYQTMDMIDKVIAGWSEAFAYCDCVNTFDDLDKQIDEEIVQFRKFFRAQCDGLDWKGKRRVSGVRLVGDVPRNKFDELPRLVELDSKFVRKGTRTISTDGSVIRGKRQSGVSMSPGGWAFVTHESDTARSGLELHTTNNRMELTAVVEALAEYPTGPLVIRTDSQYVSKTANGEQVTKRNSDLWDRFQSLSKGRKVRVIWVAGHSGDPHNDLADKLANAQARLAAASLGVSTPPPSAAPQ